jgi:broad specificity phosphatase PhoE
MAEAAEPPEPTRIVMVRHGESLAQERRIVAGHDGCKGLSSRGRTQAEALRDRLLATGELGGDVVAYTSLMSRAVETAAIISPAFGGVEIVQDCGLCEVHPGEGDGLPWDEYDARFPRPRDSWDPDYRREPGGETWNEMATRVGTALDGLVERHPRRTIVVVSHGGVIVQAMIRLLALDVTSETPRAWFSPENTSLTEWRKGTNPYQRTTLDWQLVRFNDIAHLGGNPALVA